MLSLNRIRNNPDEIKAGVLSKNESINLDEILKIDTEYRQKVHELDELRAKRNISSDAIAQAKREGIKSDQAIADMRKVSDTIKKFENDMTTCLINEEEIERVLEQMERIEERAVGRIELAFRAKGGYFFQFLDLEFTGFYHSFTKDIIYNVLYTAL